MAAHEATLYKILRRLWDFLSIDSPLNVIQHGQSFVAAQ